MHAIAHAEVIPNAHLADSNNVRLRIFSSERPRAIARVHSSAVMADSRVKFRVPRRYEHDLCGQGEVVINTHIDDMQCLVVFTRDGIDGATTRHN